MNRNNFGAGSTCPAPAETLSKTLLALNRRGCFLEKRDLTA
jgi:hypothetical protein